MSVNIIMMNDIERLNYALKAGCSSIKLFRQCNEDSVQ